MNKTSFFYRTYKNIADCYYIKSAKVCGVEAATTMKELVTDIINSVLCVTCKGIGANPLVKDAMPEQYIKKNGASCKVNFANNIIHYHYILFLLGKDGIFLFYIHFSNNKYIVNIIISSKCIQVIIFSFLMIQIPKNP